MGCGSSTADATPPAVPAAPAASAMKKPDGLDIKRASTSMSDEELAKAAAATKLQALARGKQARKETKHKKTKADAKKKRMTSHAGFLNAFALKFPTILTSFNIIYDSFKEFDPDGERSKESITQESLGEVLKAVCKQDFTEEETKALFNLANLEKHKKISFKEFLIAVSVGFFLKTDSTDPDVLTIKKGFEVVKDAFSHIDKDNGGSIDVNELKDALFASSRADDDVLEKRFAELDFNQDCEIEFPEFIYAMVTWVGFEDDVEMAMEDARGGK
jgi:calcium-binding protein CML